MSATGPRRGAADAATRAWLLGQLPSSEFAAQLAARADVVLDVARGACGDGPATASRRAGPGGVAVGVESTATLSGAGLWVAMAAAPGARLAAFVAPLVELVAAHAGVELTGPADVVGPVARAVGAASGLPARREMAQRLLAATDVVAPRGVPGRERPALVGDRLLVAGWLDAFAAEALGRPPRGAAAWVDQVAAGGPALRLWEVDGTPVALAHVRGTTPVSSRVGPVWTPPEHRRHGYAAALTAGVTRTALARGDERVVLLSDTANATSNRLYERIGYREVCAHASWSVVPHREPPPGAVAPPGPGDVAS